MRTANRFLQAAAVMAVASGALLGARAWAPGTSAVAGPADDAEMVAVPEGKFVMGSEGKAIDEDAAERPVQELFLPAFSMDKYEVTNAQFARFLNAVGRTQDEVGREWVWVNEKLQLEQAGGTWRPKAGKERFPVINVSWYGAMAYAKWAGKRLPTEAEWEKAARGTDGRKYPWGNQWSGNCARAGYEPLFAVGSFPAGASPYGCLDMAGNVWEWTSSLFKPYPYNAADGREDPQAEGRRVARGGSFTGEPLLAHASYRFRPHPTFRQEFLGFRCAR